MSSWRNFSGDENWSWLRVDDAVSKNLLKFEPHGDDNTLFELIVNEDWPTKVCKPSLFEYFLV